MTHSERETKWTRGPWSWAGQPCFSELDGNGLCVLGYDSHEGIWFARYDDDEDLANANLIAAAPQMYEALSHFENMEGEERVYISKEWLREINAILAKARGES